MKCRTWLRSTVAPVAAPGRCRYVEYVSVSQRKKQRAAALATKHNRKVPETQVPVKPEPVPEKEKPAKKPDEIMSRGSRSGSDEPSVLEHCPPREVSFRRFFFFLLLLSTSSSESSYCSPGAEAPITPGTSEHHPERPTNTRKTTRKAVSPQHHPECTPPQTPSRPHAIRSGLKEKLKDARLGNSLVAASALLRKEMELNKETCAPKRGAGVNHARVRRASDRGSRPHGSGMRSA